MLEFQGDREKAGALMAFAVSIGLLTDTEYYVLNRMIINKDSAREIAQTKDWSRHNVYYYYHKGLSKLSGEEDTFLTRLMLLYKKHLDNPKVQLDLSFYDGAFSGPNKGQWYADINNLLRELV